MYAIQTWDGVDWRYVASARAATYFRSEAAKFETEREADKIARAFKYDHGVSVRVAEMEAA